MNTDWGDNGHWQVLPISYLGFAAGAAYAWSYHTNQDLNIREALNRFAFLDPSNNLGNFVFNLGNIYHEVGFEPENGSALFHILQKSIQEWKDFLEPKSAITAFHHTITVVDQYAENLSTKYTFRPDKELLEHEFTLTISLLRHACMRGIFGFGSTEYSRNFLSKDLARIIVEYEQIWHLRNRPGGLRDSLSFFETAKKDYQ